MAAMKTPTQIIAEKCLEELDLYSQDYHYNTSASFKLLLAQLASGEINADMAAARIVADPMRGSYAR